VSARAELVRYLQKFLSPREIAQVLSLAQEMSNEASATAYAKGRTEGIEVGRTSAAVCRVTPSELARLATYEEV
jgi:hypothetical protein